MNGHESSWLTLTSHPGDRKILDSWPHNDLRWALQSRRPVTSTKRLALFMNGIATKKVQRQDARVPTKECHISLGLFVSLKNLDLEIKSLSSRIATSDTLLLPQMS